MSVPELDSEEERNELVNQHATEQIEERFRKVFQREMTREERRGFFMPSAKIDHAET
jgi:hypothetical protein